jgi:DNA invertase Pin-like site-specific DNA recombinase
MLRGTPAAARFVPTTGCPRNSRAAVGSDSRRSGRWCSSNHPRRGRIVVELVKVESGRSNDRPQLAVALAACRKHRAVQLVARLDQLARNARFLLSVVEGSGEGGVVFCDPPAVQPGPAGKFIVTTMAAAAELKAGMASQRTKAALAAAKARGRKPGGWPERAGDLRPHAAQRSAASAAARAAKAVAQAEDLAPVIE